MPLPPHQYVEMDATNQYEEQRICARNFMLEDSPGKAIKCYNKMLEIEPDDYHALSLKKTAQEDLESNKRHRNLLIKVLGSVFVGHAFALAIVLTIKFLFP